MAFSLEGIQNALIALEGFLLMRARTSAPQGTQQQGGASPPPQHESLSSFGMSDERGFLNAFHIAVERGTDPAKLLVVVRIIISYPANKRERIVLAIGGSEDEVVEKIPQKGNGPDGKPLPSTERRTRGNLRGAGILQDLSKMSEEDMRIYLGVLTTSKGDIILENLQKFREHLADGSPVRTAIQKVTKTLRTHRTATPDSRSLIFAPPEFSWWPNWIRNLFRRRT